MSKIVVQEHFVIFVSPGTLYPETTLKAIDAWDVDLALKMADGIEERHGATPYCFYFITRGRDKTGLDSKEIARSVFYFLGGRILTLEDIKARKDPEDRILILNIENNKIDRVIENCNSYKVTLPLGKDDIVLDFIPKKDRK